MPRKKASSDLPPEVKAVLCVSPNLQPRKRKYGRMPLEKFLKHVREDRCKKCAAFLLQLEKESTMMQYLRDERN